MAVVKIAPRGPEAKGAGGLVRYMFGKGKSNEHTDQRTVAGNTQWTTAGNTEEIKQVHQDLQAYARANPQANSDKHIWHCSITLAADEGRLSDGKWQAIAQDYMNGMGFTDPNKAPIRWTAINHGLNTGGSDHIHIVMSMIREDGTKVNIHDDAKTSSKVMAQIEKDHGLKQLAGRGAGVSGRNFTGGEKGKALDNGHEIERVEIERIVRGAAGASTTEAEFVRRLREAGMEIRPRVSGDVVTGYSVGMPGTNVHFAGGKIARDLTLPRLRLRWAENPSGTDAAALEWIHGRQGKPLVTTGRETRKMPVQRSAVTKELDGIKAAIPTATRQELREISQDLAGAQALAARVDPSMAKLSRQTGRWGQTRGYAHRPPHRLMNVGLLLLQASDPDSRMADAILVAQVLSTLRTIHEFHQARCQVAFGKEHTMSQPIPEDGIGEAAEGVAVVGVTVGAQSVQRALQNRAPGQVRKAADAKPEVTPEMVARDPFRHRVPSADPHQQQVIAVLGKEMKLPDRVVAEAANLPKWDATDLINRMKETVGADRSNELLEKAGLTPKQKGKVLVGARSGGGPGDGQPQRPTWRDQPMTNPQRDAIEGYSERAGISVKDLDGFENWSAGDASDAISAFQQSRTPEKIRVKLNPDAQAAWDPSKIKPHTTAAKPSAGPIIGDDIRNLKGRGGR